jgi:hypothetical protein
MIAGRHAALTPHRTSVHGSQVEQVEPGRAPATTSSSRYTLSWHEPISLPRPEHVRAGRDPELRRPVRVDVAVVPPVDGPVLDREHRDPGQPRRLVALLAVVLVRHQDPGDRQPLEQPSEPRDLDVLAREPPLGKSGDLAGERAAQVDPGDDHRPADERDGAGGLPGMRLGRRVRGHLPGADRIARENTTRLLVRRRVASITVDRRRWRSRTIGSSRVPASRSTTGPRYGFMTRGPRPCPPGGGLREHDQEAPHRLA